MTKQRILRWMEACIVLGIGFVLIVGILYKSGVMKSGYHFLDDHEVVRMEMAFEAGADFGEQLNAWVQNDLHWRFRPLYWAERVTGGYLFGADMLLWNLYTAVKGILAFALLYYVARYLGHNRIISTLFPCIIMFGAQFTPWYRSANQENTGLLLVALVLFLITGQYAKKKFSCPVYNVLIIVSTILCGLIKESFAMCIPAFMALKYWLEYCNECKNAGEEENVSFVTVFKNNWWTYVVMLVVGIADLACIMFLVGVDNVSYAGFQAETPLIDYVNGISNSLTVYLKWYTLFGAMIIFIVIMCRQLLEKRYAKQYIGFGLIGFYIIGIQLVAHAKSLMWERYIIPCIIGYGMVFVLLGYELFRKHVFQRRVYTVILVLLLMLEVPVAYDKACAWAYDGQMIAQYFQCILDNSTSEDMILCAFSDEELNLSSDCWLEAHGRANVEYYQGDTINADTYAVVTCYTGQVPGIVTVLEATGEASYSVCEYMSYAVIVLD
ncbi:MAG: hypothetical protein IJ324_08810 [Lachnospiraceae bacterium]|nr:hypothetical protein [Lachnospiraceae bacterium]